MPLDPLARDFLDRMRSSPQPYEVGLDAFREAANAVIPSGEKLAIGDVHDRLIEGGDGQPLAVRIYVPEGTGPFPAAVWLHGGSFVRGTLDQFDALRRTVTKLTSVIVVAVDQRLSPEATFPAPIEDGYAALRWATDHIAGLGGDPTMIGIAGESSGGNLAAAVARLARDRDGPHVAFQLLIEPILDAECASPSMHELAEGYLLTRRQLLWAYQQYAPGEDAADPLLSPLHAPDITGLPPTAIITIEFDPARDDGERYAARLGKAGVPVRSYRIPGMVHHFPGPDFPEVLARATRELLELAIPGS